MAKGNTLKWIGATAAGAVVGALAVRALDKYVLAKDKKKELSAGGDEGEQQFQGQAQQNHPPQYGMGHGPSVMPVFLPFPMSPMGYQPPMPPSLPPPSNAPPIQNEKVPEEEVDIVSQIEEEWDDD